MVAGGGSTGSQHSRSGYSLAIAAPTAAANSSHTAANMMADAAVRLSVVHHWPGTGRPRGSIKRRRLHSAAVVAAVVVHILTVAFFSFTVIGVVFVVVAVVATAAAAE
jgi:hypothetical protein